MLRGFQVFTVMVQTTLYHVRLLLNSLLFISVLTPRFHDQNFRFSVLINKETVVGKGDTLLKTNMPGEKKIKIIKKKDKF